MAEAFLQVQPGFPASHTEKSHPLAPLVVELQERLGAVEDGTGGEVADLIDDLQGIDYSRDIQLSFESGEVGTHKLFFADAVTITKIRTFVTQALAATDDGTITARNSAGAAMAGGAITVPASSVFAHEPAAVTPTTNNTVAAGGHIQLVTAKTTPGGGCRVTIEFTRTPA